MPSPMSRREYVVLRNLSAHRVFTPALALACAVIAVQQAALAAAPSIPAHQAQAATCRATFARASSAGSDVRTRVDAAARAEDCFVRANDAVIPLLSRGAGEGAEAPNVVQTYRDASGSLCGLLAERSVELEAPAARAQCVANRESELARLIDEYAPGGKAPHSILTGVVTCDDAFNAARASTDASAWSTLGTCAMGDVKTKARAFVPAVADGDPLGTLSHSPEQVAMLLDTSVAAGGAVCDLLAPTQALARARCRVAIAANMAKAVATALR
jgi:hypothetical protein